MFTLRNYVLAESLEQAYELLNKNKNNAILGGMLWLKMGRKNINTSIDLSNLGLDKIIETTDSIDIGCMCTLGQLENSDILQNNFSDIIRRSVVSIVGTQFKNSATVGGSVYSRFGFSDLLTALLVLDSYVQMHNGGTIPIREFVNMPYYKDILVKVIIKKNNCRASYIAHRNSETDFPVLTVSASRSDDGFRIAVGARPMKAALAFNAMSMLQDDITNKQIEEACDLVIDELSFGTNIRATAEYRKILARVMVKRALEEICL